ncbi:MAG: hypothetical protein Kow0090_08000 [Myxococcota bacterium]
MAHENKKDAELIDDLDLLGPIEESGVTSRSPGGIAGDKTDIVGRGRSRTSSSDVSAERTTIIDAFALTGRRPILTITAGPDAGKEITIEKEVFEIGRGTANDYVLHDLAVSRKHVKFVSQGETYQLVDMGSGNGSKVNGVRVQEIVLHDGDEIAIGNTVMRFEWPLESSVMGVGEKTQIFAPISQIRKVKETKAVDFQKIMPWLLYGGGGLIIMAVIIIVVMVAVERIGKESGSEGGEGLDVLVQRNITAGIADYNAGRFAEAQKKFIVALTLEPTNPLANEYKAKSESEIQYEMSYQQAQKYIAERNFEDAAKEINKIPKESYFTAKLVPLKERLMAVASSKLDESAELIERGQFTRAERYLNTVKIIDPENPKTDELLNKISELKKSATASTKRSAPPRSTSRGSSASRTQEGEDPWERKGSSSPPPSSSSRGSVGGGLARYTNAYKGGDIQGAISMLEASDDANTPAGKELLKKFRSFKIMYSQGKSYHQRGAGAQAKKFLEKARSLDREIVRGSKYADEINRMLKSL